MENLAYSIEMLTGRSTLLFWVQCVGWMLYFVIQDAPFVGSLFFAFALSFLGTAPLMIALMMLSWIVGLLAFVQKRPTPPSAS